MTSKGKIFQEKGIFFTGILVKDYLKSWKINNLKKIDSLFNQCNSNFLKVANEKSLEIVNQKICRTPHLRSKIKPGKTQY